VEVANYKSKSPPHLKRERGLQSFDERLDLVTDDLKCGVVPELSNHGDRVRGDDATNR